jgi:hypothetical protein
MIWSPGSGATARFAELEGGGGTYPSLPPGAAVLCGKRVPHHMPHANRVGLPHVSGLEWAATRPLCPMAACLYASDCQ